MTVTVVNQSNAQLSVAAGADETINGDKDVIAVGAYATLTVNGYDDAITGDDDTLSINDNGGPYNTVNGADDTITVPVDSLLNVNGSGDTIQDAGHGYLKLFGAAGSTAVVTGAVLEFYVPDDFHVRFTGTQNDFYLGAHDVAVVAGDDDNLFGSDDRFVLTGCIKGGDEIEGSHDRAVLSGTLAQLLLYGNNEVTHDGAGTSLAVMSGTDDRFIGAGFHVLTSVATNLWIGGNGASGADDTVTGDNFTGRLGGNSNIVISGDDDTVSIGALTHLYLVGDGLTAHVGHNASVSITGKGETSALITLTGVDFSVLVGSPAHVRLAARNSSAEVGQGVNFEVQRSDDTVTAGISDTISILSGASNHVILAPDDVINDGGSDSLFSVTNNIGTTTINGFAADPAGVVDLLSGLNGWTSGADAAAAAVSDGAGGLKLSLGIYGSIDFAGDTTLSAANFKLG